MPKMVLSTIVFGGCVHAVRGLWPNRTASVWAFVVNWNVITSHSLRHVERPTNDRTREPNNVWCLWQKNYYLCVSSSVIIVANLSKYSRHRFFSKSISREKFIDDRQDRQATNSILPIRQCSLTVAVCRHSSILFLIFEFLLFVDDEAIWIHTRPLHTRTRARIYKKMKEETFGSVSVNSETNNGRLGRTRSYTTQNPEIEKFHLLSLHTFVSCHIVFVQKKKRQTQK